MVKEFFRYTLCIIMHILKICNLRCGYQVFLFFAYTSLEFSQQIDIVGIEWVRNLTFNLTQTSPIPHLYLTGKKAKC